MSLHEQRSTIITKRRVDFQFDAEEARHWCTWAPRFESFLNAISFMFPPGEKFFIESVQNYKHQITDPVLQDDVRRFVHQEAMHTSMHSRFNRALAANYPLGPKIERMALFFLNLARWLTPKSYRLAVTCANEHFTALLSDLLLTQHAQFASAAQSEFTQLWAWHAIEETEHKAVCFDVYCHVVGRGPFAYLIRAFAMLVVSGFFLIAVTAGLFLMRKNVNAKGISARFTPVFEAVLTLNRLLSWRKYMDYFRPTFHPWQHDSRHYLALWREYYPQFFQTGAEAEVMVS